MPFDTDPRDAFTYVSVGIGLLAVATLASYLPIRQASVTNPRAALDMCGACRPRRGAALRLLGSPAVDHWSPRCLARS